MGEETLVKGEEKEIRNEKGQFVKGYKVLPGTGKHGVTFATKWKRFIEKVAESEGKLPEELDEELFAMAKQKAREGDYSFYKDIQDRLHGKATQPVDVDGGFGIAVLEVELKKIADGEDEED